MRLHLRFDRSNPIHTRLTLLVNGAPAGELTMRNAEAVSLNRILLAGSQALRRNDSEFAYESSGHPPGDLAIDVATSESHKPDREVSYRASDNTETDRC